MSDLIAVGLSGGVDSAVAACLLKEQGYNIIALFMQNWHDTTGTLYGDCPWEEDYEVARLVARNLDIPLHYVDLSAEYRKRVVDYMFSEYEKGRTPNPDVLCNREIKFDAFMKAAAELGAAHVATGHYCRKDSLEIEGQTVYRLLAGVDGSKDQSYFLCQLSQYQLSKALFPIGHLQKSEVRQIAAKYKLPNAARKDSQGICFVGKVDLPVFLQQQLAVKPGNTVEIMTDFYKDKLVALSDYNKIDKDNDGGDIKNTYSVNNFVKDSVSEINPCIDTDNAELLEALARPFAYRPNDGKKIGTHNGAHFFTVGQRKGINIGGHVEPLFVISTDVNTNTLYVGEGQHHPGLFRKALKINTDEIHWVRPDLHLEIGKRKNFLVRIRYRQALQAAELIMHEKGLYIIFEQSQRGITAGQFAAWYLNDELIGSGIIS